MRKTSKDEAADGVVRMDSPADLQRWSERFGVTPVQLKAAVGAVGPQAGAVQRYLQAEERPGSQEGVAAAERNLQVAPSGSKARPPGGRAEGPVGSADAASSRPAAQFKSGHGKPQSTDETELAAPRPTRSAGAALGAAAGAVAGGAAGIVGGPAGVAAGAAAGAALGGGTGLASAKSDKPAHGGDERPQRSSKRRG